MTFFITSNDSLNSRRCGNGLMMFITVVNSSHDDVIMTDAYHAPPVRPPLPSGEPIPSRPPPPSDDDDVDRFPVLRPDEPIMVSHA